MWQYIYSENIPTVPLYHSAKRPVVERDGQLITVDDDRLPLKAGETPIEKEARFRTLGHCRLKGAVESRADTVGDIVAELMQSRGSERKGRAVDNDRIGSME